MTMICHIFMGIRKVIIMVMQRMTVFITMIMRITNTITMRTGEWLR